MAAVIGNASGDAQPPQSAAYEDALQRAREIASKIQPDAGPGPMGDFNQQKRPLEDAEEPGAKKLAGVQNDPSMGNPMGMNSVRTEPFKLPDRLVGLVIGKGGETITRLQTESGCRVQIAPESPAGSDERPCTLTGTPEQISHCSAMLTEILMNANQNNPPPLSGDGTVTTIDIMIPADKCGIIIGKKGDTIKSLKMNLGVQMNLIQSTTMNTGEKKPLRISGDPARVEQAKQAIEQIMQQRDEQMMRSGGGMGMGGQRNYGGGGGGGGGSQQPGGPESLSIQVPRPAVGVVIGKGGDMITKIQNETGTRIQFREDNDTLPNRLCSISGTAEGCRQAQVRVEELIQSVQEHDASGVGGTARRRPGGSTFGQWEAPGMGGGRTSTVEYKVPANKTGLVIGKRGENIRQINQQSGAHVEIQRNPPPGSDQQVKTFIIKGTAEQIQHAQHLIQERVDGGPGGGGMGAPQQGYGAQQSYQQQPPPGTAGYAPPNGAPPQQGQQYGAAAGWNPQQQYQQWQQPTPQQNGGADADAANKQTAAWAAYYAQFNSQQPGSTATTPYQQQVPAGMPQMANTAAAAAPNDYTKQWEEYFKKAGQVPQAGTPQPASSQGQADYSQAWAEYYRQYSQYYTQQTQQQYSPATGGQQQ